MSERDQILDAILHQTRIIKRIAELLEERANKDEAQSQYEWTPDGLPICPKHREAMPRREKQGDVWYSHKVVDDHGEVHFCKGYPGNSSNGWDVGEASQGDTPAAYIKPMDVQRVEEPVFVRGVEKESDDFSDLFDEGVEEEPKQEITEAEAKALFYTKGKEAMTNKAITAKQFNDMVGCSRDDGWVVVYRALLEYL